MRQGGDLFHALDDVRVLGSHIVLFSDIALQVVKFKCRLAAGSDVEGLCFSMSQPDFLEAPFGPAQFPVKIFVLFLLPGTTKQGRQERETIGRKSFACRGSKGAKEPDEVGTGGEHVVEDDRDRKSTRLNSSHIP